LILIKASIGLLWFEVVKCSGENHMPKLGFNQCGPGEADHYAIELPLAGRFTQFKGYGVGAKC
jgi:hypothetical protein